MGTDIPILLFTLAILALVGFVVRGGLRAVGVPPALSLIGLGMLLGSMPTNPLPNTWLELRPVLSYVAFVLLLLRAGLMISPRTVRRILGPALALGTVPVLCEWVAATGLLRLILFDRWDVSVLAAFIVAAVSPAVILPIMIRQRELNRSAQRMVPERIIGMTIVNAFIAQTGILAMLVILSAETTGYEAMSRLVLELPVAIAGGVVLGVVVGLSLRIDWILSAPRTTEPDSDNRLSSWTVALVSFAAAVAVYATSKVIGVDSVVATLALGICLRRSIAPWLSDVDSELRQLWSVAEIVLFVNVGSYVDLRLLTGGPVVLSSLVIVAAALFVRVLCARYVVRGTSLSTGEQRYTTLAQIPKATIQAVFGAIPLAEFTARQQTELIADGQTIVVLAAVAIISTAPLGAVKLERRADELLERSPE